MTPPQSLAKDFLAMGYAPIKFSNLRTIRALLRIFVQNFKRKQAVLNK